MLWAHLCARCAYMRIHLIEPNWCAVYLCAGHYHSSMANVCQPIHALTFKRMKKNCVARVYVFIFIRILWNKQQSMRRNTKQTASNCKQILSMCVCVCDVFVCASRFFSFYIGINIGLHSNFNVYIHFKIIWWCLENI